MTNIKAHLKKVQIIYKPVYWLYLRYLDARKCINKYTHRQRRYSYGSENPDKTFYVIGVPYTTAGLFAIVKSVFCHICYAYQKGFIPVVDMQNFKSQLSYNNNTNTNAWELYFQQPGGYNLKDISKSRNIIKSSSLPFPEGIEIGFDTSMNDDFHNEYASLYEKYVVPTPKVDT